jgi:hypothetical protein
MTPLGHGHFEAPLDPLPNERVLWEGGAGFSGVWIRIARVMAVPVATLAVVAFLWGGPWLFQRDVPAATPATKSASASAAANAGTPERACRKVPAEVPPCPASVPEGPRKTINGPALLAYYVVPMLLATFAYGWLANRNAWYVVTTERICIQTGLVTRALNVFDLDRVLAVEASSSLLERWAGVQTIQFLQGGARTHQDLWWRQFFGADAMAFVPTQAQLLSHLLNEWLPRDGVRRP